MLKIPDRIFEAIWKIHVCDSCLILIGKVYKYLSDFDNFGHNIGKHFDVSFEKY